MTNPNKKTKKVENLIKEGKSDLERGGTNEVLAKVDGVHELLHYTAERFNAMREQLANCCQLMKYSDSDSYKYIVMSKAIAQGDFGRLLDDEDATPTTFDVEDAALFTQHMKSISETRRFDTRLNMCVEVHNRIKEAIERWQSKVVKMESMSRQTGSTDNEMSVAIKKKYQFLEAIKVLKQRASLVAEAFYAARKQVSEYLEAKTKEFQTNETQIQK